MMIFSYSHPKILSLYHRLPDALKSLLVMLYSLSHKANCFGGVFWQQLEEFQFHRHWPQERLLEDQLLRLRNLLNDAGTYVPYYREMFKSIGFDPKDFRSLKDLRQLPILDKETVREKGHLFFSQGKVGRRISTHTSGTTGKALHLKLSVEANQRSYACVWFHYSWVGVRRGDRVATLAGHQLLRPSI